MRRPQWRHCHAHSIRSFGCRNSKVFLSRGTLGQSVRLPLSCLSGTTPRTARRVPAPSPRRRGPRRFGNRLTRDGKVANPTPFAWAYDSMHSFVNRERCVWPVVRMLAKALRSRRRWPTYALLRSRHKQPRSVARTTPRCANPASDCLDNPTICKEPLTLLPISNSKEARKRG